MFVYGMRSEEHVMCDGDGNCTWLSRKVQSMTPDVVEQPVKLQRRSYILMHLIYDCRFWYATQYMILWLIVALVRSAISRFQITPPHFEVSTHVIEYILEE